MIIKNMAKITYENKEFLNQNSEILDKHKCNDADLNQIKNVVNTNDDNAGDLTNLSTNVKDNLVDAINEVNAIVDAKGKALKIGLTNAQSVPVNTVTTINFDKYVENNFNNAYDNYLKLENNGVRVMNDNIKAVVVVFSIQTVGSSQVGLYITKNGNYVSINTRANNGGQASAVIPVTIGDLIAGSAYAYSAETINTWSAETFIEVSSI